MGRRVRASETENAELLWGLRGGGGNFGVVVEFEFRLHRVSQVLGGLLAWPAQAGGEILRFWRDWVRDTPDELCTMAAFLYAPPEPFVPPEMRGAPIFAIACFHTDLEGSAGDDLQALRDQKPALDVLGPMPYTAIQGMFDAGVPRGSRNYWRSGYVNVLTDEAIDAIVARADGVPAPLGQLHLHQLGGALSRVPAAATAFGNRKAAFLVNYVGLWLDPAQDEANTAWVREASDAIAPYGTGMRVRQLPRRRGRGRRAPAYEPETLGFADSRPAMTRRTLPPEPEHQTGLADAISIARFRRPELRRPGLPTSGGLLRYRYRRTPPYTSEGFPSQPDPKPPTRVT